MPKMGAKTKSVSTVKTKPKAKVAAKRAAVAKAGDPNVLAAVALDVATSQVGLPMGRLVDEVRRVLAKSKQPEAPRDDVRRAIEHLVTARKLEVVGRGLFPMTTAEDDEDEAFRPRP